MASKRPGATRKVWKESPSQCSEGTLLRLDFRPLASRTVREEIPVFLNDLVCGS